MKNKRKKQAKVLRDFRKVHRTTGALLFVFFFVISISGVLLGWKKNSNELLLPKTYTGSSTDFKNWLPLDSLNTIATQVANDSLFKGKTLAVDRIDVRQKDGIVKFTFKNEYWGVQVDGATGEILNIGKRHSDFVENLHDGSILDTYFNTSNGQIKVVYTTVMGLALLLFTITGFWLWYGPKRMRKDRKIKES
tara:strand:+ start:349209 stop:349787 length:579 start_codon:yes stop_codon:yes gene_type:complete